MAYITISMSEIMDFIDSNVEYNKDRIKGINVVNQNHLELLISVGPFFPTIKATIVFNRFEEDTIYLNVLTNGGVKMLMGLVNEMGNDTMKRYIKIEKGMVEFYVNKLLEENMKGVKIKAINISGEQIYVTIGLVKEAVHG